jgi:hypothetical protein
MIIDGIEPFISIVQRHLLRPSIHRTSLCYTTLAMWSRLFALAVVATVGAKP